MPRKLNGFMAFLWWFAGLLLAIGGLNWGLIGAFDFNLVESIFGNFMGVVRTIYVLVGLSAVWVLFQMFLIKPMRK